MKKYGLIGRRLDRRHRAVAIVVAVAFGTAGVANILMSNAETVTEQPSGPQQKIIVRYRQNADTADKNRIRTKMAKFAGRDKREFKSLRMKVVEVNKSEEAQALTELTNDPDVEFAEAAVPRHKLAVVPNDPDYSEQWFWSKTQTDAVWERTKGSADVVIAVLDDGFNYQHEDLTGQTVPGFDVIGNDSDPTFTGRAGDNHGTNTAGIVGAIGNNGKGVAGACWQCKIMPVRILDDDGNGDSAELLAGMEWAMEHGADILSMSIGGYDRSTAEQTAIDAAVAKGIFVVAAAGNDGVSPSDWPGGYNGVISAAATTANDSLEDYSNFGNNVDLAAPGEVYTTSNPGSVYDYAGGTSFSTPLIAGIAGLLKSAFPNASLQQLTTALTTTADTCCSAKIAGGRVNALKAYNYLAGIVSPTPTPTPTPTPKPADLNQDGKINLTDLSMLLAAWNKSGAGLAADINKNGKVDLTDLSLLLGSWNR